MVGLLLVRQEVSVSGSEPSKQTFQVRRPVIKVIPEIPGGMTPYYQINLGAVGANDRGLAWDTNGPFAAWCGSDGAFAPKFKIWSLPSGAVRDVSVATSGGGLHIDDLGNIIVGDTNNIYVYSAATGALLQTIARGIVGTNNFGSQMDDVTIGGVTYLVMLTNGGFTRNFTLLTDTGGAGYVKRWETATSTFTSVNSARGVSVGPVYAYFIGENNNNIDLVDVATGGLVETIVTPAGLTGDIAICHYDKGSGNVVIVCVNGDIFVYDYALAGLILSKTGNGFTVPLERRGISKRMKVSEGKIGVIDDANVVHVFRLVDLALVLTIVPASVGWIIAAGLVPQSSINSTVAMILAPDNFNPSYFLFMAQEIPPIPEEIISESQFSTLKGNFLQVIDLIGPAPLPADSGLVGGPDDRREKAIGKLKEFD